MADEAPPDPIPADEQEETTTEAERVDATAERTRAANASAPSEDPLALAPWDRHEDVEAPLTAEQILDRVREAQGLELIHTRDGGMIRTWAEAETAADEGQPVDEQS